MIWFTLSLSASGRTKRRLAKESCRVFLLCFSSGFSRASSICCSTSKGISYDVYSAYYSEKLLAYSSNFFGNHPSALLTQQGQPSLFRHNWHVATCSKFLLALLWLHDTVCTFSCLLVHLQINLGFKLISARFTCLAKVNFVQLHVVKGDSFGDCGSSMSLMLDIYIMYTSFTRFRFVFLLLRSIWFTENLTRRTLVLLNVCCTFSTI